MEDSERYNTILGVIALSKNKEEMLKIMDFDNLFEKIPFSFIYANVLKYKDLEFTKIILHYLDKFNSKTSPHNLLIFEILKMFGKDILKYIKQYELESIKKTHLASDLISKDNFYLNVFGVESLDYVDRDTLSSIFRNNFDVLKNKLSKKILID